MNIGETTLEEQVARAMCAAGGHDPSLTFQCNACSLHHEYWEKYMAAAASFVAAYGVMKKMEKAN